MAKELPYFKFEPAEYLTKDISFCSLSAQGLFINICSYYWQRNCKLTKQQLLKRLNYPNELEELILEGAIDLIDNIIIIKFLDSQLFEVEGKSKTNSTNGSKGGRPNLDDNITTIFGELIPRYPEEKDHFLYLFKRMSNNTYKIGETQDLFKRRNTMKISSKDLSIIHFVKIDREASLDIERDIKNQFLNYNIGGDWFDFKSSDIQLVINAINKAKKANEKPIESQSKGIREDKIIEDKIKENIINNAVFVSECKNSTQWIEVTAMQNKISPDVVNVYIDNFENHLITMQEQKKTLKEYKEHFTHWFKKQDLSEFRIKSYGKTNQI